MAMKIYSYEKNKTSKGVKSDISQMIWSMLIIQYKIYTQHISDNRNPLNKNNNHL